MSCQQCDSGTYEKWLHIIGKMISKDSDSKYFGKHIIGENLINGSCNTSDNDVIFKLQNKCMKIIDKFNI